MNVGEIIYRLNLHAPETASESKLTNLVLRMAEMIWELQCRVDKLETTTNKRSNKMGRHGEPPYPSGDKSPEEMERDVTRRYRERITEEYSDSTRAMLTNFVCMYSEIESLGESPEQVAKRWWPTSRKEI